MKKQLKTVVEFVHHEGDTGGGGGLVRAPAEGNIKYRDGAEMISYNYDKPKEVVKFYNSEDVRETVQAWAHSNACEAVASPNNYVVMQANPCGWNQYNIGTPLRMLTPEEEGYIRIGDNYFLRRDGFFIKMDKQGMVQFSDFIMDIVAEIGHYRFDGEKLERSFKVVIIDATNFVVDLDIPAAEWKSLMRRIEEQNPVCTLLKDSVPHADEYFRRAAALLLHRKRPCILMVDRWGWGPVKKDGTRDFYHGGRKDCSSGKKLLIDDTVSLTTGFSILEVGEQQVTVPLLLYCAASYMDALFSDAGYPIDFCMMLVGDSGFMKTAFSKVLFNVFVDKSRRIHSVRGTEAAMHALTEETYDDVLVVDDFNLEGSKEEVNRKARNIQGLIRTYSDKAPREKFSVNKRAAGYHVRGGCVFTAETRLLGQIKSAELRYLRVNVTRPMDGDRLAVFQQNPAIMETFWARWIQYLENNYGQICLRIQRNFSRYREAAPVKVPRLKDDLVHLRITLDEMVRFIKLSCSSCVDESRYSAIIAGLVYKQAEEANQVEPYVRCLAEIFALLGTGQLRVAPTVEIYISELKAFAGYKDGDVYMLNCDVVYSQVIKAARDRGDDMPLTIEDMKRKFKEHDLLSCGKDGILKRGSSKIPGRPRLLALRYQACLRTLEDSKC